MRRYLSVSAIVLFTSLLAGSSRAAIIVNDQFNDGDRAQTTPGLGAGTGGETEIPWFQDASTVSMVTDNTSPLSGSAMQFSGGATVGTFGTGASNVTLGVGDSIALSVAFRFTAAGTANVRFGLYNDNGTPASDVTEAGAPYTGDRGYLFIVTQAGTNNNYTREIDNTGALAGGTDQTNFAQSGTHPALGTTGHTAVLTLTRTATGIQINGTVDGNSYGTVNDNTGSIITSFGQVVLSASSIVAFDNVTVTTVPEPATAGLLGAGALTLLARRTKRRSRQS